LHFCAAACTTASQTHVSVCVCVYERENTHTHTHSHTHTHTDINSLSDDEILQLDPHHLDFLKKK
jgi:hypothetical protein